MLKKMPELKVTGAEPLTPFDHYVGNKKESAHFAITYKSCIYSLNWNLKPQLLHIEREASCRMYCFETCGIYLHLLMGRALLFLSIESLQHCIQQCCSFTMYTLIYSPSLHQGFGFLMLILLKGTFGEKNVLSLQYFTNNPAKHKSSVAYC